jgi:hypothetical protein
MLPHHQLHLIERPFVGVRAVQKCRDLVSVGIPACVSIGDPGRIPGFGGRQQIGRDQDVVAQQRRELATRRVAIERLDRISNIGLILQ